MRTAAALVFACLCALAATAATASEQSFTFRAYVSGRIVETWSYTKSDRTPACTRRTRSKGSRVVLFRSAAPARVQLAPARRPRDPARLPPTQITSITGTLQYRPGNASTTSTCEPSTVIECTTTVQPFGQGALRMRTRKNGTVALGRIRHPLLSGPLRGCGAVVNRRTGDVDLVDGQSIPTRELGNATIELRARYTATTLLELQGFDSGSLLTTVDWKLRLVRGAS